MRTPGTSAGRAAAGSAETPGWSAPGSAAAGRGPAAGDGNPASARDAPGADDPAAVGYPAARDEAPGSGSPASNSNSQAPGSGSPAAVSDAQAAVADGQAEASSGGRMPGSGSQAPWPRGWRMSGTSLAALARRAPQLAARHWLAALLLAAGVVLRVLALIAYRPALIYVDTLKYLYNSWSGSDPVGYKLPLHLILLVGNLEAVAVVQHLLGLAMAVTLYAVLIRRGVARWLAAIAIAPVLLDAYQLQSEQTIMPDVWLEGLIVAGLAVLLWKQAISTRICIAAGLILGASATIRQIGEVLVFPAVIFVLLVADGGWRNRLRKSVAVCAAFAAPILLYMAGSYDLTKHFDLSRSGAASTYGRMASAADCATLSVPAALRPLCPAGAEHYVGADRLDHDANSPAKVFTPPPGVSRNAAIGQFNKDVIEQQPLRVLGAYARDVIKLFGVDRLTNPGDTPISRWQFQPFYPSYLDVSVARGNLIILGLKQPGGPVLYRPLDPAYGGPAAGVNRPLARFLHSYQRSGGYTPGPFLLLAALAGLAGTLSALLRRRSTAAQRQLALGSLLFFVTAATDLLISDLPEFSWRYQLPAVVTLPIAGAFGIAALARFGRARSEHADTGPAGSQPQLASSAG